MLQLYVVHKFIVTDLLKPFFSVILQWMFPNHCYFFIYQVFRPTYIVRSCEYFSVTDTLLLPKLQKVRFLSKTYYLFIYLFIYYLPRIASSVILNCYQWGSYLPCETATKEPCWLTIFNIDGLVEGLNSEILRYSLNVLTVRPRIA